MMSGSVPYSTIQKWREFVDRLSSLTAKNKIKWKDTSDDNAFVTSYGGAAIILSSVEDVDDYKEYEIKILDKSGSVIDAFTNGDLDVDDFGSYRQVLSELMKSISRDLTGAESVLSEILNRMKKDDDDDAIPF